MQLVEVNSPQTQKDFLLVPVRLHKNDADFIRPLDKDINGIFDPKVNKKYRQGDAKRWILKDEQGQLIGRIAAFYNEKDAAKNEQPTGGCGFFECADNQDAANLLFDTAKDWLQQQGMEAMDGPINFGERNNWWGLMVQGFGEPVYQSPYNPPYYKQLFENYGWQVYFEQYNYGTKVSDPRPQGYPEAYERLTAQGYHFEHIKKNNLPKYTKDFLEVYNAAWEGHKGIPQMNMATATKLMKTMKPIIAEELMYFGYKDGKPVSFYFSIPDLNQWFKHFDGKFGLIEKLRFLWMQRFKHNYRMISILFGVVPEHQGKGVEAAMVMEADKTLRPMKKWEDILLTWIGDFNPKMMKVAEKICSDVIRTYVTYRYLFDRTKEFKRHPKIGV